MNLRRAITLDVASVTTAQELLDVCGRAIGMNHGDVFEIFDQFDHATRPLAITVIGIETLSKALPLQARYLREILGELAKRHGSEGVELRFV